MSARDSILDAFEDLLVTEGERAATLDAVAARASVSKGGLLYHFKSKDALAEALLDRLSQLVAADLDAMRTDPRGASAYYVETSVLAASALDRALIATARLSQEMPRARETLQDIHRAWYELILGEVGNRGIARAIMLIGDGLYYNAVLAGAVGAVEVTTTDAERAELLEVVAGLKEQATTAT